MKWKKVSEHPLPKNDGVKWYILKFKFFNKPLDSFYMTQNPEKYECFEWCEFNPDEIESADRKFYGKSEIEKFYSQENFQQIKGQFALNEEIKFNSSDELYQNRKKNIYEKTLLPINSELSWEEKFRWETARDDLIQSQIVCALRECSWTIDNEMKQSISLADTLIKELKRGRE